MQTQQNAQTPTKPTPPPPNSQPTNPDTSIPPPDSQPTNPDPSIPPLPSKLPLLGDIGKLKLKPTPISEPKPNRQSLLDAIKNRQQKQSGDELVKAIESKQKPQPSQNPFLTELLSKQKPKDSINQDIDKIREESQKKADEKKVNDFVPKELFERMNSMRKIIQPDDQNDDEDDEDWLNDPAPPKKGARINVLRWEIPTRLLQKCGITRPINPTGPVKAVILPMHKAQIINMLVRIR